MVFQKQTCFCHGTFQFIMPPKWENIKKNEHTEKRCTFELDKHQNLKQQLIDDQTVLVDRDISTSQDPWAKNKKTSNGGRRKTGHARPSFHFVFIQNRQISKNLLKHESFWRELRHQVLVRLHIPAHHIQ